MAQLAIHDLLAFDDAVKVAMEMTSAEDTLIVVTADHGHTMAMGGYSVRGNPIFGEFGSKSRLCADVDD